MVVEVDVNRKAVATKRIAALFLTAHHVTGKTRKKVPGLDHSLGIPSRSWLGMPKC
jgi:hypothetical protein